MAATQKFLRGVLIASVIAGVCGIGLAIWFRRRAQFIARIDLGDNDFAGAFYILITLGWFAATAILAITVVWAGAVAFARNDCKYTGPAVIALGFAALGILLSACFIR